MSCITVLILVSISFFHGGKTFGAAIDAQTLEFDGKEYSSSPADQTTAASAFDANFNVITSEIFNKAELQAIIGINKPWIFDGQADQTHPLISFRSDSSSLDKPFTHEPTSGWSFIWKDEFLTLPEYIFLFFLMTVGIGIGLARLFYEARAKGEKWDHRRKRLRMRRRYSIGKMWPQLTGKRIKFTYFHSDRHSK